MGTPAFMAPEQAQAVASEVDGQTDLWAVGATMFTLLTGQLVHDGGNNAQLLIQAGTAKARPITSVLPDLPRPIAAVVDRALAFEKAERWPSAARMREAILAAATECFGSLGARETLASLFAAAPAVSLRFTARTEPPRPTPVEGEVRRESGSGRATPPPQTTGPTPTQLSAGSEPPPARLPRTPAVVRPPLEGSTTGNPVSSAPGVAQRSSKSGKVVTAGALVVALGAVAFAFRHPGSPTAAPEPPRLATASASTPAPAPAPAASSAAKLDEPPAASGPVPASSRGISSASTPASTKPRVPLAPASTVSTPRASASTQPVHDCAIAPYWYDARGDKHWYPECQQ
jgi:serine/threonine-protein kinase